MDTLPGLMDSYSSPLSLTTLVINLLLSVILSSLVAWFYTAYGQSLSNRAKFALVLPVLTLTTVLVISVVKSSLALSLGLVGALSIVRFRTAIKEPEELVYLFIAIAIGLGMGADQRLPTLVAVVVTLGYLFARAFVIPRPHKNNLYLNVLTSYGNGAPPAEDAFDHLNAILLKHVTAADLRRLDRNPTSLQATYLINCHEESALSALMNEVSAQFPECELSLVEQDTTLA
ncbi:MAG: DUF4956 domain-containing protein [Anaerolineae bacterium]|nr:DUF4956 domain-containing protein [Anaerolineae bacterium]